MRDKIPESGNSLVNLIFNHIGDYPVAAAESIMYGLACVLSMEFKEIKKEYKGSHKEKLILEFRRTKRIIKNSGMDIDRIKTDGDAGNCPVSGVMGDALLKRLEFADELLPLDKIVTIILDYLTAEYKSIYEYTSEEKKKTDEPKETETAELDNPTSESSDIDKVLKETENDGKNWRDYLKEIGTLYSINGMEKKLIKQMSDRFTSFAEKAEAAERFALIENALLSIIDNVRKSKVSDLYASVKNHPEANQIMANYKAEEHRIMREVWDIISKAGARLTIDKDRFTYLSEKYCGIYDSLINKVIGQDYAVNEFVRACFDAELYNEDPEHPEAVFLFAGAPGVGKSFLSKSVAKLLGRPFKIFDMSSYSIEKSYMSLIGSEANFRNASEGELVGFVEDNPDAVILFDEIEKAHPEVTRLFLSVLEGARLENKFLAKNTDFSHTIIIFTTNACRKIYEGNIKNLSGTPTELIIKELREEKSLSDKSTVFPPELCSRFASSHILMFNNIGISDMVGLVKSKMDGVCNKISERLRIHIDYDKRLPLLLIMHYGGVDLRIITEKAEQFIHEEIYELARQMTEVRDYEEDLQHLLQLIHPEYPIRQMSVVRNYPPIKSISIEIDNDRISDKAKKFFNINEKGVIALTCGKTLRNKIKSALGKKVRIVEIDSVEKMMENEPEEITAYFIDPYYEMKPVNDRIMGLEDYDSTGLRIIKDILQKDMNAPVYLLEDGRRVSRIDRESFYMRGVEDTVNLDSGEIDVIIKGIVDREMMQKKCEKLINRRKVFDYETLQEMPDNYGHIKICIYDIVIKDAVSPEDKELLISIDERPDVRFDDVIGAENAKYELRDFIKYLENPRDYLKSALSAPKGILFFGPPGTGKTMLAKAMAGETDATFISVSASELRSNYDIEKVKRLFTTARKYAPSIIFIDEVDAIAKRRTGGIITSSAEEALLNMLLSEIDGFYEYNDKPVFIIAATNFSIGAGDNEPDSILDPAFLRRFGNKILIDLPNKDERIAYLKKRLFSGRKRVLNNKVTVSGIRGIAERTPGRSLAEIQNVLEFAFRNAARKGRLLTDDILDDALDEYFHGEEKERDDDEMMRTAVHEAAHAYIYRLSGRKPSYMTVISRGNYGGYMQREESDFHGNRSKEDYLWDIRVVLAGRIGETVIFGDDKSMNSGASSDLRQASSIALNMISLYGMGDGHLFSLPYEDLLKSNMMSEYVHIAEEILSREEKECRELIQNGKSKILQLAKALMKKNHLNREEIEGILG